MNILHVGSCEIVEMRDSADADGYPCSRTASTQCLDCGSELCESHTETCGICNGIFCPSCLTFHQDHTKPALADHGARERNRAEGFLSRQRRQLNTISTVIQA